MPVHWFHCVIRQWFFSLLCSMGFVKNPLAFLRVLQSVINITGYRFIIFTAGYEPLNAAICTIAKESASSAKRPLDAGISIFSGKLFCFSGWVQLCEICNCRLFWKNRKIIILDMAKPKISYGQITFLTICLSELVWCHTIGCFEDVLLQFIMVAGDIFSWITLS